MNLILSILLIAISFKMFEALPGGKTTTKRFEHYDHHHRIQITHPSQEAEQSEVVDDDDRKGYSIGSGLRSIAQGSADQANNAVANQHAAAVQAAYVAKSTLAQSAIQAASTALAALAGKEVLLHSLEHQRDESAKNLESELQFLQLSKRSNLATKQTSQQAQNQAAALAAALNNAQALIEFAENSVKESSTQLAKQSEMVGRAKSRLENIESRLKSVKIDFEATKDAAAKAAQAANEAHNNANSAAQHATIGFQNNANNHAYQASTGFVIKQEDYEIADVSPAYGKHVVQQHV